MKNMYFKLVLDGDFKLDDKDHMTICGDTSDEVIEDFTTQSIELGFKPTAKQKESIEEICVKAMFDGMMELAAIDPELN